MFQMNFFHEIITSNFVIWVSLFSFLIIFIGNRFSDKYTNILFFVFIGALAILDASSILDYYFRTLDTLNNWRYVTSILGYLLRTLCIVILVLILFRREKIAKFIWLLLIPLAIEAIFVITSPFTKIVFSFDELNNFHRGPIGLLPLIISGFYIVLMLVLTFVFSSKFDRIEVLTVFLLAFFAIIVSFLESFFNYSFLTETTLMMSCLFYYLCLFIRHSHVDDMTGVFNRQSFFQDVSKFYKPHLVLIMVDLNGLKAINDTQGHEEGDKALCTLASCLNNFLYRGFRVYRIGGDEFMVIAINKSEADVKKYIALVKRELSLTPYMASFGYANYFNKEDLEKALFESDQVMYKDKKNYKNKM